MRVCVLSDGYPPRERGGAQKIAAQLAEGYSERGHEVSVVTTVPDRDTAGRNDTDSVTVHRLYSPRPKWILPYLTTYNPFVARGCDRLFDRLNPDVVHAHNVHWLSNASLRLAAERAPVVKTFHDAGTVAYGELTCVTDADPRPESNLSDDAYQVSPWRQFREEGPRYFPLRNRLNRRALNRHVATTIAVSDALCRALTANGVPCHGTIHNGVDAGDFDAAPPGEAFRREAGLGDAPFVLFGGRTSYNKGGSHLAAAFARICETTDRDVRLVITGDDGYVDRMRTVAGRYGDRILTTGWLPRTRLRAALKAATAVTTPSVHLDPFPTVNLEALAAGTPVVTSLFGGGAELVDDGEDGKVVDPRDVGALAEALAEFVVDPDLAAAAGAAGRRKVEHRYTVDGQVEAYLDVLDRVTDGKTCEAAIGRERLLPGGQSPAASRTCSTSTSVQ